MLKIELQLRNHRLRQFEVHVRALAVTVRGKAACVIGAADLPGEAGRAVALIIFADCQLAPERGVAVRRAQIELAQFDAVAGPAAGQVERVRGKHRLAGLGDIHRAHVYAVEQQVERRFQRKTRIVFFRARRTRCQSHADAFHIKIEYVQLTVQQRPRAQVEVRLGNLRVDSASVAITHAGEIKRAEQAPIGRLHLQRTVRQRLRARQREAQAG